MARDPLTELALRGGAARLDDLPSLDELMLDRALRDQLVRFHAGKVLAMYDADPGLIAACALRGTLAETSAARFWGLPLLRSPGLPTVVVPATSSRRRLPGVDVKRRRLGAADIDDVVPVTTPLRTVVDCARYYSCEEGLIVADGAASKGLVTADSVVRVARALRGPSAESVRRVARLVDPRCESLLETLQRLMFLDVGASFQLQVLLPGVGAVDALVEGWLVCEPDGFEFHRRRADYRRDRRWGQAIAALGFGLLRWSYEDLVHERERTTSLFRRILANRPPSARS